MKEGIKNAKANELDAAQIHFHHRTPPPRLLAFKNNPFLQTSRKVFPVWRMGGLVFNHHSTTSLALII